MLIFGDVFVGLIALPRLPTLGGWQFRHSNDWDFERLGTMKFVRSLAVFVLLSCVTLTLGCTEGESTGGAGGGGGAGSGVAGGAPTKPAEEKKAAADAAKKKADEATAKATELKTKSDEAVKKAAELKTKAEELQKKAAGA